MSNVVAIFNKRARSDMNDINWAKELQKTVTAILKDKPFETCIKANAEFSANLEVAQDFIKRVLEREIAAYPETFFFALRYFLLLIDEEHSRLESFKYEGALAAFPLCAVVKQTGRAKALQYILIDQMSKQ